MKRLAILGSTGSIGTQALDVVSRHRDAFEVVALAAGKNVDLLGEQVKEFAPKIATTAADGPNGLRRAALDSGADIILAATDGFVAFDAVFAAIDRGIDIAVANKELIVAAGELLFAATKKSGSKILPVDSEHSAIFQCLLGESLSNVASIILTASGGPFRTWTNERIENATVEQALKHPTWHMGAKNTIDSATLMNKGLEIIEAARFFPLPHIPDLREAYRIVIHPQSIVHGFVAFQDNSIKAQLCVPDMRIPISFALGYPQRLAGSLPATSSAEPPASALDLEPPDFDRFPCLGLAYGALERGGVAPAVLSAANEVAVEAFLAGRLSFGRIPLVIEKVMKRVDQAELTLESVRAADRAAREFAANEVR